MNDAKKFALIREVMPATEKLAYFNTGSVGPISTILSEAIASGNETELREGRASMPAFMLSRQKMSDLRDLLTGLVKAEAGEVAVTHHTTDGMNIMAHGFQWQAGDEVVTTTAEHPGGLLPFYVLRERQGVVVKLIDLPADISPEEVVARFETAISPRTRMLAFSHVLWNTGMRLPLAEIVAMAHRHHVLCAVDGAQSAGAIPLDLPASGVDFYAFPGQKWLCGPEGTGGLYVRRDRLSLLKPTFVGYRSMDAGGGHDWAGSFTPQKDARRFETGSVYRPGIAAMAANLGWLQDTIGWEWIHARIAHLAEYAHRALSAMPGVTVITPPGRQAGLVTFNLDGYPPPKVMTKLGEEGIVVRFIPQPLALRISTGFYNSEADIDRLVAALAAIQKIDPELLPDFGW